jgi:hypothetical protein
MSNSEKSRKSKKIKWWSLKKTPPKSKQYDWLKINKELDSKNE